MRISASILAGFLAVSVASSIDGNWHIGCDEANTHCFIYQDQDAAVTAATEHGIIRKFVPADWTCQECTAEAPCDYCGSSDFSCEGCAHWQCMEKFLQNEQCLDVPPELAEAIFNEVDTNQPTIVETTTALSTDTTTVLSTATVTVLSIDTQTVVSGIIEYTTVTVTVVMPTPPPGMVATTIIDTFQTADQLSPRGDRFGCAVCPGDASCDKCHFTCEDCLHLSCDTTDIGYERFCADLSRPWDTADVDTSDECTDTSISHAASLHIRDISTVMEPAITSGGYDSTYTITRTVNSTMTLPSTMASFPVEDGPRPAWRFQEDMCVDCGFRGENCTSCDWQFICGMKKLCTYNGAREIVELCYERGEKCE